MKNSSLENLDRRCAWIEEVVRGTIDITAEQENHLKTMKDFSKLEIKTLFAKISYNTLKTAAIRSKLHALPMYSFPNKWMYLLHMRGEAYQNILEKRRNFIPTRKKIDADELEKQAMLHAHICSTAYFDIYKYLEFITLEDKTLSIKTKKGLKNFLAQSSVKFHSILSCDQDHLPATLKLVLGGKKR
ncbi:hypothetical protein QN391_25260 [Pseudomonas sp. CCI1.2]|uniref:hypothetical protein n=1 Tax=Pseudomonas sp. CCI1.2 TaxID=3048614 RepID=UPI002B225C17|nr:hypothetical protein [Pseudomonas sp. CCI1.2]MEB0123964.1 hypothetical protein [Pseudomonas sp. CCI1.2]